MYTRLISSGCIFILGSLITVFGSKILSSVLKKVVHRTNSKTDDYILKVLLDTVKPLGISVSAFASWRILAIKRISQSGIQVTTTETAIFELCKTALHPNFRELSRIVKGTKN